jgi:golgin subfamily B member 1
VRAAPRTAAALRRALRLFDKSGQADGAWNAACALEILGEADINESLLAGARCPEGLLPARDRVAEKDWSAKLFCPERDAAADDLFAALDGAALEVGLETARRKRRLPALDPSTAEDPETSTATLAKTLLWTSKLLGLDVPRLHVLSELNANLLTPPAREPTLLANRALGSGLELSELAFLWGRQLAFLRPEHRLVAFYPTVPELAALVLAALSLGGLPQLPFKKLEGEAKLFARSLKRHLSPDALERLALAAGRFPVRDAGKATLSWCRAVELSASRAGLLACGSLETAAKMSERFPLAGQVEPKAQLDDLLSFAVGPEYAVLRERLGVALTS